MMGKRKMGSPSTLAKPKQRPIGRRRFIQQPAGKSGPVVVIKKDTPP